MLQPLDREALALVGELAGAFESLEDVAESVRMAFPISDPLAPGFHRIVPPIEPKGLHLAVIVPRSATVKAPLCVVPRLSPVTSTDEFGLRAGYGSWLDAGAILVYAYQEGGPAFVPGRDPFDGGFGAVGIILATLRNSLSFDPDRVLVLSRRPFTEKEGQDPIRTYQGDLTGIAAQFAYLPGAHVLETLPEPSFFAGRLVAIHASTHAGDATRLLELRLRDELSTSSVPTERPRIWTRYDPAIDLVSRAMQSIDVGKEVLALTKRPPEPEVIYGTFGSRRPRHEWLGFPFLTTAMTLKARRTGDHVELETLSTPEQDPVATLLAWNSETPPREVRWNGKPVGNFEATPTIEEALLAARATAQSGRPVVRILRVP